MKNRGAGDRRDGAGVSSAGSLRAGVSSGQPDRVRVVAASFLLTELQRKVGSRNTALRNVLNGLKLSECRDLIKMFQTDVDTILWIITCCGLVEIDERARRDAACPEDLRATLSDVLGTSQKA